MFMKAGHRFGLYVVGTLFLAAMSAAKKQNSYTEKIPGTTVSFKIIAIPGGTFQMGSPAAEKGRNADEGPLHPVTGDAFWIGQCEVTWDEYELFVYTRRIGSIN